MKFWYPNTAQWVTIWVAGIVAFVLGSPSFFQAIGCYDAEGNWLGPYSQSRLATFVVIFALLLVWQFSRPVAIRSPLLIPAGFLFICAVWFVVGSIQQGHRVSREKIVDPILTPDSFMETQENPKPLPANRR